MNNLNTVKRYLGLVWMLLGPVLFIALLWTAIRFITASEEGDVGNPVPWIIILAIFCPIAVGLTIFGWYCWKGEYDDNTNDNTCSKLNTLINYKSCKNKNPRKQRGFYKEPNLILSFLRIVSNRNRDQDGLFGT